MSKRTNGASTSKAPAKAKKPTVAKSSHKLADKMPEGTQVVDLKKRTWKLGKPIGSGGFGLIYLAEQTGSSLSGDNADCVLKIEPHDNGPLFCELHFYQRAAQPDMIKDWMTARSLKFLGIPKFHASGLHERDGKKFRFMVMQRCGSDVQKLFERNNKRFQTHTVFQLGLKMLDALEYMHSQSYAHADIKASNILLGHKDPKEVYLIDFGLAFRFNVDGKHKDFKEDPRKAHDGTIEFTSRDAHNGVSPSRRGDLEVLGYCMLQWLCGQLPWEDDLVNKNRVRDLKMRYMNNIPDLLSTCFPGRTAPAELSTYLQHVVSLRYDEEPGYGKCRQLFSAAIKKLGHKDNEPLDFAAVAGLSSPSKTSPKTPVAGKKRKSEVLVDNTNDSDEAPVPAKSPRLAGKSRTAVAAKKEPIVIDEDEDDENCAESSPPKSAAPKRVWPKAKKSTPTGSRSGSSVTAAPVVSLKGKKTPPSEVVTETRSPLAIAAVKKSSSAASVENTKVLKRKRNIPGASISTQTSPSLAGLPRPRAKKTKQ